MGQPPDREAGRGALDSRAARPPVAPGTVGRVLTRVFAAQVLLIVLSGLSGVVAAFLQHRTVTELSEHVLPLQLANADLRATLADAQRGLRGYLLTGDATLMDTYHAARTGYPGVVARLGRIAQGGEDDAVNRQVSHADTWWVLAERQRRSPPRSQAAAGFVAAGRPLFQSFLTANEQLDSDLTRRAADLRSHSRRLGISATAALGAITACAALLAAWTAVRTTRRITGPLHRVVTVLDRLGQGRMDSRADPDDGPAEIRAVAFAVNAMAGENQRARERNRQEERLRQEIHSLGVAIRQHMAVESAVREAAAGLGTIFDADHVLVRVFDPSDPPVRWSAPDASGSLDELAGCTAVWPDDNDRWVAVDPAEPGGDRATEGVAGDHPTAADPPAELRAAWRATGAGPVAVIALRGGETQIGAVTLVRAQGRPAWTSVELGLAAAVTAELGRGVHQARLYEQEQQLVARLQELDTAKNDFMSTVSHELRTPLTSIAGYLEMLLDGDAGPVSPGQAKMLDVIARNTARLRALIEDLLVLSRIEAGTFRTQRAEVDVHGVIDTAVAAIKPAAAQAEVSVAAQLHGAGAMRGDADQLDRVLMNLLSNAVKFTPAGGAVTVSATTEGDEMVITVADTGMGIPETEQHHLFTRFFRASNAVHHAIPGTGLGLTIVRTIVAAHGGSIELSSREGTGTTVTVRLPAGC